MDEAQIDKLARSLGSRLTRRTLGGIATGALAALGVAELTDAKKKKKKKKKKPVPGGGGGDGNTCQKQCSNRECGSDGCGGSCGTCADNTQCVSGTCEGYASIDLQDLSFLENVLEIVTDSSGVIYIMDSRGAVYIKPVGGTSTTFSTQGSDIWDMATDSSNLYFTDRETDKVRLYTKAGVFISEWGSSGSGAGELNRPSTLAAGGGYVFVQDWVGENPRLQRFDATTGNNVRQIAPPSSGLGSVDNMIYSDGEFFVANNDARLVHRYSESGAFLNSIGAESGPGKLTNVSGVAVDHKGRVLVLDPADERIAIFQKTGEFVTEIAGVGGNVDFSEDLATFENRVYVIYQGVTPTANSLQTFEASGGSSRDPRMASQPKREHRQRRRQGGRHSR